MRFGPIQPETERVIAAVWVVEGEKAFREFIARYGRPLGESTIDRSRTLRAEWYDENRRAMPLRLCQLPSRG